MMGESTITELEAEIKNATIAILLREESLKELEKLIQAIPLEMMLELKKAADTNEVSLNIEVVSRLLATAIEPYAFGFSPKLEAIAHKKIQQEQIKLEKKQRKEAWECVYELDKLKILIMLEKKLPKDLVAKEMATFKVIDVEKERQRIKREMAEEAKKEGGGSF